MDEAHPAAAATGGPRREEPLALDLAPTRAERARLRSTTARLLSATAAGRARPERFEADLFFGAEDRLGEVDREGVADVATALSLSPLTSEHVAEDRGEQILGGLDVHLLAAGEGLREMPRGVVAGPLRGIAEHRIGDADPAKALLGLRIVGVSIGVGRQGEAPIGALDLVARRLRVDPKDCVVILRHRLPTDP